MIEMLDVPKLLSYTFGGIFLVYSPVWYFAYPGFGVHEFNLGSNLIPSLC